MTGSPNVSRSQARPRPNQRNRAPRQPQSRELRAAASVAGPLIDTSSAAFATGVTWIRLVAAVRFAAAVKRGTGPMQARSVAFGAARSRSRPHPGLRRRTSTRTWRGTRSPRPVRRGPSTPRPRRPHRRSRAWFDEPGRQTVIECVTPDSAPICIDSAPGRLPRRPGAAPAAGRLGSPRQPGRGSVAARRARSARGPRQAGAARIARGLYPVVLRESGLAAALAAVAEHRLLRIGGDVPDTGYPTVVESTAYRLGALASESSPSTVSIGRPGRHSHRPR
jgi:hypothetical protein